MLYDRVQWHFLLHTPPNSSTWTCFAAAQSLMWLLFFAVFIGDDEKWRGYQQDIKCSKP
jgi:hypothetical protein